MAPIWSGSSSLDFFQNSSDVLFEISEAAVILNDVISQPPFFFQAQLRVDVLLCFGLSEVISLLQTAPLRVDGASDQDHGTKRFMQLDLEEQRNFINNDGVAGSSVLSYSFFGQRANARVDDRFEFFSTVTVVEDDGSKFLPIECLVWLQDACAERVDDFLPGIFAWFDNLAGQLVGIDNRCSESRENFCDGAFSGSDSPCQTDQFHAILLAKSAWACKQLARIAVDGQAKTHLWPT